MTRAGWLTLLALFGCPTIQAPTRPEVASIEVSIDGIFTVSGGVRVPLQVVSTCAAQFDGGQAAVPASLRGKEECRHVIARGAIEVEYTGRALDSKRQLVESFSGPVSVRVVPGDFATPVAWSAQSAGAGHVVGLRTDGTLWTWGTNDAGQLGDQTTLPQTAPMPIAPGPRWSHVSAGGTLTAAIRGDGTLWAFGSLNGQLGTAADFVAVSAGGGHVLALRADGTLHAAGLNDSAQLGDGTTTSRIELAQIGTDTWSAIAAGAQHSLAVRTDGSLWAFGSNSHGQLGTGSMANATTPTRVDPTVNTWRRLSAGTRHSLATRTDGTLWATGSNDDGQLGLGNTVSVTSMTRVGTLTGWDTASAGATHSLGLRQGTLFAWGRNTSGELGDTTMSRRTSPQSVGTDSSWSTASAGAGFSVGLKNDGSVFAWGSNVLGQLARETPADKPYRTTPSQVLTAGYENRWKYAANGVVRGVVRVAHQYGQARLWLENGPPRALFDGGTVLVPERLPPEGTVYSFATGASPIVWFEEQTLQTLNMPDTLDNRSSPFVGEFVRVGTPPEMGSVLRQTCPDDPARNGAPMAMVVTGVEPTGFYVTDITACRQREVLSAGGLTVRTAEHPQPCLAALPDGGSAPIETITPAPSMGSCSISRARCTRTTACAPYSPGTFGSLFVFNFSFPEGLNQGDLLFSLSGAVQEFTSTTQMTFPAWTIAERVRLLPPDQWDKWLRLTPPVDITYRRCGLDDVFAPFITDALCGQSSVNLKLESLEAALVRVRGVKLPERFVNCDFDANASVPFFCNRTNTDAEGNTVRSWGGCDFDTPPAPVPEGELRERECNQRCTLGRGPDGEKTCSEEATFIGFGQYAVEMAPPGPAWANLDDSNPARIRQAAVAATVQADGGVAPTRIAGLSMPESSGFEAGTYGVLVCDVPVRWRTGPSNVAAGGSDPLLEARTVLRYRLAPSHDSVSVLPTAASGTCWAAINPRTRLNLDTKDAIPELNADCREDDPDAEAALQCRRTRAATYDIVGHLKQVQPARPRWIVIPRDPDDVCCYPGPDLECPRPLRTCNR